MRQQKENRVEAILGIGIVFFTLIFNIFLIAAVPTGPTNINATSNSTKSATSPLKFNISGGYISKINISATTQNPHWKAFVGWIDGRFTLDDATGSTIYDWTLSSVGGEVYATRTSNSISWSSIGCATTAQMESENIILSFDSKDDNITATFSGSTHDTFVVAGQAIAANSCPTLNTYVNNASQDTSFEEVVLDDGTYIVYSTILEEDVVGYDGQTYDFQMLVPDNSSDSWDSAIAYYLYVELS